METRWDSLETHAPGPTGPPASRPSMSQRRTSWSLGVSNASRNVSSLRETRLVKRRRPYSYLWRFVIFVVGGMILMIMICLKERKPQIGPARCSLNFTPVASASFWDSISLVLELTSYRLPHCREFFRHFTVSLEFLQSHRPFGSRFFRILFKEDLIRNPGVSK